MRGAAATWWQVHISREGQIIERFTRAVDQLGSEDVDVRIGGIYALERIAKNSPADRSSIQYLLGPFVRYHAAWPVGAPDGPQHPTATVDEHLSWLNIRAPLQDANLRHADLSHADLRDADLTGAILDGAILIGAQADSATTWPVAVDAARWRQFGIIEDGHCGPGQIPAI